MKYRTKIYYTRSRRRTCGIAGSGARLFTPSRSYTIEVIRRFSGFLLTGEGSGRDVGGGRA